LLAWQEEHSSGNRHFPLGYSDQSEDHPWDKKIAPVLSGGNIDMNLISRLIEKGLIQDSRLVRISVVIPDRPGS
jgi:threonine dehydratase